jgi:hypothetical protein
MLGKPDPFLKDLDGNALARERNYNGRPPGPALEEFALLRAANVERLQRLAPEDLDRKGSWELLETLAASWHFRQIHHA